METSHIKIKYYTHKLALVCLLIACVAQAYVVIFLLKNDLYNALFTHMVVSFLFPWPLWRLMPDKFQSSPAILSLLFLFCLLIPIISGLALLVVLTTNTHYTKPFVEEICDTIEFPKIPEYLLRQVSVSQYWPGGSVLGILETSEEEEQRIQAVLATRQMPDKESIPILRIAMLDPLDDVRLLAYLFLDKKEKIIDHLIHKNLKEMKNTPETKQVMLHKSLAEAYWELSFLGLTQGLAQAQILNRAYEHAQKVISLKKKDAEIYFLHGRIALALGQYSVAEHSFQQAQAIGLSTTKLAPYQAELAFEQCCFEDVGKYFSSIDATSRDNKLISEIMEQWSL